MLTWATEIIGAAFAFFVLFILVMRVVRLDQKAFERRQRRVREAMDAGEPVPPARTPADDFHDQIWLPQCQRVTKLAARQMQRPLTYDERRAIWRSRSQLVLEVLLKELEGTSPGAAIALLKNAPSGLDRPDPTGWCENIAQG